MPTPVIMPKFGMTQEEGTIIRWLKNAGDGVEKGETLLEVQTDKVDMDVESPASGILGQIQFGVDVTVKVATVIAQIFAIGEAQARDEGQGVRGEGETASQANPPRSQSPVSDLQSLLPSLPKASPVAQRIASDKGVDLAQISGTGLAGRITKMDVENTLLEDKESGKQEKGDKLRATPAARRLAGESLIELETIKGSGPNNRIQVADVETFLATRQQITSQESQPQDPISHSQYLNLQSPVSGLPSLVSNLQSPVSGLPSLVSALPLRGIRKTIATRLTASWQTIPHVMFTLSVDMSEAESLRGRLASDVEKTGGKFTPTVLIAKAVAAALLRHPKMNAWLQGDPPNYLLTEHATVHLGIAVALEDGLIVPVLKHVETLGLAAIAAQIGDLAARARTNQLQPSEVQEGTFTLSNLGMYPLDHFTAIINPPQVGILAIARTQIQPVWDGASFQPRPLLQLTLSADHRAVDGAVAAAFLSEIKHLLEEPSRMLI